jgi:hypothetical protein
VQSLFLLALVYLLVARFPEILKLSCSAFASITKESNPASSRLLETALPSRTNYTSCGSDHSEKVRAPWAC